MTRHHRHADGQAYLGFWAPVELLAAARERADADGVSMSELVRRALSAYGEPDG